MTNFANPHFAEPQWLWLAVLGPVLLIALQVYAAQARKRQLARIAAPEFVADLTRSHSSLRRNLKNVLLVFAFAGIGIALARPQWGVREITTKNLSEDIVFAVDCSRSMLAADVSPHRLGRAKLAVQDFVRRHTNGRVGLVAFAGQAFLQCPLTFDHGAFEDALLALDEKTIVVPGTDVGSALDEAFRAMEKMDRKKVIVLITDGEDLEKSGVKMAKSLAEKGVVVFTIGVGTEAGAEIRVMNEQGQMELILDSKGQVVRSRLDEPTLRGIAEATHGNYYPLGALGEGLAKVRTAIESGNFDSGAAPVRTRGIDRFHVPVAAVLVLLVAESLIGTRRRWRANAAGMMLAMVFMMQNSFATAGTNGSPATNGTVAVKQAAPEKEPETAREFFNTGTQRLRDGKLREAEGYLLSSLTTQDERVQPQSLYNLGHVRYELGKEELKKSPDATAAAQRAVGALERGDNALQQGREALASEEIQKMVRAYLNGRGVRRELREATDQVRRAMEAHGAALLKWQRALGDFKSALELNPADADAKRNIEILEEAIARLIDKIRALQQLGQLMGQQSRALGEMMKQLRGKLPAPDAPPGGQGDEDEEDEDSPNGPREGQQEGPSREGQIIKISREEAGWILDAFKLGGDRRLPMGQGEEAKPKDRKGRNW